MTMVYTDVPVSDFSSNLIGNDIDLTVKAKGGSEVVYPNDLSSADRYNNQEQVEAVGPDWIGREDACHHGDEILAAQRVPGGIEFVQ